MKDHALFFRLLKQKRAQHIAEYMLVFEVFLVATIITVTALGMLPDIGATSLFRTSDEMLSLGPLGLLSHTIDECGGYSLKFRNTQETPITLTAIQLGDEPIFSDMLTFQAGQELIIEGSTAYRAREGNDYALSLQVTFRDETTGAVLHHQYDEKIYGSYGHFKTLGKYGMLHQGMIDEYCFLGTKAPNHIQGRPALKLFGPTFMPFDNYYALVFDGVDDYAEVPQSFTRQLSAFAVVLLLYLNFTRSGAGIIAKQNAFSLTTEGNALRFTLIDKGTPYSVVSPPLHDGWWYVVASYDGNALMLMLNDTIITQRSHQGAMDASLYPLYLGTFTPESGLFASMKLLYFALYQEHIAKETAKQRYKILTSSYFS